METIDNEHALKLIKTISDNKAKLADYRKSIKKKVRLSSNKIYKHIGVIIRDARNKKNYSQEALACMVGLERTSITQIEKGKQRVALDILYAISVELGLSMVDLFKDFQ